MKTGINSRDGQSERRPSTPEMRFLESPLLAIFELGYTVCVASSIQVDALF